MDVGIGLSSGSMVRTVDRCGEWDRMGSCTVT